MIAIKAKGAAKVANVLRNAAFRRVQILTKRVLEYGISQAKAEVERGDFFNPPGMDPRTGAWKQTGGDLQASGLWASDAARRTGSGLSVQGGWTRPYGPVLEFGSEKPGWPIKAKFAPFLRFRKFDSIVRAKEVYHRYDDSQKRPHWGPSWEKVEPDVLRMLDRIPEEINRG